MDAGRVTTSDRLLAQFRSEVISMFIRGLITTRYPTPWPNFNDLNVIKAASTLNLTTINFGTRGGFEVCRSFLPTPVEISVDKVIITVLNRPVENF